MSSSPSIEDPDADERTKKCGAVITLNLGRFALGVRIEFQFFLCTVFCSHWPPQFFNTRAQCDLFLVANARANMSVCACVCVGGACVGVRAETIKLLDVGVCHSVCAKRTMSVSKCSQKIDCLCRGLLTCNIVVRVLQMVRSGEGLQRPGDGLVGAFSRGPV